MTPSILTPVVLSILRHLLTLAGGAALATKHDSELAIAAGLLVAIGPVIWGALSAKLNHEQKVELNEDVKTAVESAEKAKTETQLLRRIIEPDGGSLKL